MSTKIIMKNNYLNYLSKINDVSYLTFITFAKKMKSINIYLEYVWLHMEAEHNLETMWQDVFDKKFVPCQMWIQINWWNTTFGIWK